MAGKLEVQKEIQGDVAKINLSGNIDEDAFLDEIFADVSGPVVVNTRGIKMINSCGVRDWIRVMSNLESVEFHDCSIPIVEQLNMISNFSGNGKVKTFVAPFWCPNCENVQEQILDADSVMDDNDEVHLPVVKCEKCHEEMEFDDIEDEYFSFLE